jgi:hypothetical protein
LLQQALDLVPPSLALEAKLLGRDLRQLPPETLSTVVDILTYSTRVHGWTMKAGARDSAFVRLAQLLLHFNPEVRARLDHEPAVFLLPTSLTSCTHAHTQEEFVYRQVWDLLEAQLVDQREGLFPNGPADLRAWVRHLRDPASLKLLDQALGALLLHPYAFAARLASLPPPPHPSNAAPFSPLLFAVLDALAARTSFPAKTGDEEDDEAEDERGKEVEIDGERARERAEQEIYAARSIAELLHSGVRYTALAVAHALSTALPPNFAT